MALVVAFVAAVTTGQMPLNVLQLLWVNLIMDALAALGNAQSMCLLKGIVRAFCIVCVCVYSTHHECFMHSKGQSFPLSCCLSCFLSGPDVNFLRCLA